MCIKGGVLVSDMDSCHTDEENALIKLIGILRWLKSAKHKQGFVKALPFLPLGSCSFLNGWAEAIGRALLRLVQPWPPTKLRKKLQVKPWVQTQQNSRRSLSFTLLWELGGRDSAFFQKKEKSAKVFPVQRVNFGTSCFCNTHPSFVKISFYIKFWMTSNCRQQLRAEPGTQLQWQRF